MAHLTKLPLHRRARPKQECDEHGAVGFVRAPRHDRARHKREERREEEVTHKGEREFDDGRVQEVEW